MAESPAALLPPCIPQRYRPYSAGHFILATLPKFFPGAYHHAIQAPSSSVGSDEVMGPISARSGDLCFLPSHHVFAKLVLNLCTCTLWRMTPSCYLFTDQRCLLGSSWVFLLHIPIHHSFFPASLPNCYCIIFLPLHVHT